MERLTAEVIDHNEMVERLTDIVPGGTIDEVLHIVHMYVHNQDYIPISYIEEYAKHHDAVCQMNLEQMIKNYMKGTAPDEC